MVFIILRFKVWDIQKVQVSHDKYASAYTTIRDGIIDSQSHLVSIVADVIDYSLLKNVCPEKFQFFLYLNILVQEQIQIV